MHNFIFPTLSYFQVAPLHTDEMLGLHVTNHTVRKSGKQILTGCSCKSDSRGDTASRAYTMRAGHHIHGTTAESGPITATGAVF